MLPAPLKFLNLSRMNERRQKLIGQKAKDDATMNFVSRRAQEAILNPILPESYKDEVVGDAVGKILKIAERRNAYSAPHIENRQLHEPRTIYNSRDEEERPAVISEINEYLKEGLPEDAEAPTVESIAEQLDIHRLTLYDWLREDQEFAATFGRVKHVQQNDPFKTTPDVDRRVNSMAIAMVLIEKRDRHNNPQNS